MPVDAEMHGYDMFHGELGWSGVPPRVRIAVYNQALKAIGAHDVTIILRGVNRHGLTQRYVQPKPAHEVVLSHVLERVDAFAAKEEQLALVIADEVDNQAAHRADLTRYREDGTGGYRSRQINRIVDTLHFAPSHSSRLVQAVDLVTFLHRRMQTVVETDRVRRPRTRLSPGCYRGDRWHV
ncbi:DUF3800 domain-containing protein [Micromonospora sp. WMMD1102]|uniref:DUF3800 domain-containing protein n=1 Tax=Micromonospora sp. WMMD1102 TaxID=3016105 RepID=UPI002414F318|nr:DUF3800 domain-containing protein [Micromonospora sp. WMMD1102]MDG4789204.1 DUF3800 domain-containing protein [Micromonospora sp. WMMD1102]